MINDGVPVSSLRKDYKRLTEDEIREIINQKNNGVSAAQIAQQIQCSERQIHRIIKKSTNGEPIKKEKRETDILQKLDNSVLQEHHLAWIQEEFNIDPNISLEILTERLNEEFNAHISVTTIWRAQKAGLADKVTEELRDAAGKFIGNEQILQ